MSNYQHESREFVMEVEQVAAELIRDGVAPWDAVLKARRIVQQRRERAAGRPA